MKQVPEGWLDWNTLSLDQMVEHLRNKYEYSSTGDAMCIHRLIEFYEKNKKGDLQSFIGPVVPGITIADARRYCENHGLGYVGIYRLIQVLASW